jgi:hypothetical protein
MGLTHGMYLLPLRNGDATFLPLANGSLHPGKGTISSAPHLLKWSKKIRHHEPVGGDHLA